MADSKLAALSAAAPFATTLERVRPHTKLIGLLALGHLVIDVTQGSLANVVAALGWVGDHFGLRSVLTITALLPHAGFAAARFLPAPAER